MTIDAYSNDGLAIGKKSYERKLIWKLKNGHSFLHLQVQIRTGITYLLRFCCIICLFFYHQMLSLNAVNFLSR